MPNIDIDEFLKRLTLTREEMVAIAALLTSGWVVKYPAHPDGSYNDQAQTIIILTKEDPFYDILNRLGGQL